jgi:hypothetical protein
MTITAHLAPAEFVAHTDDKIGLRRHEELAARILPNAALGKKKAFHTPLSLAVIEWVSVLERCGFTINTHTVILPDIPTHLPIKNDAQ